MDQAVQSNVNACDHFPPENEEEALFSWLISSGMGNISVVQLLEEFCERLVDLGINVCRGNVAVTTIHPQISAFMYTWRKGEGIITNTQHLHSEEPGEGWFASPFFYMLGNEMNFMHRPLEGDVEIDFPVLAEFKSEGMTDWFSQMFDFGWELKDTPMDNSAGIITSWASDAPGGFTVRDFGILKKAIPLFALAIKALASFEVANTVLETYVGRITAREVLAGQIHRGQSKTVSAVLLFADLRGFTNLADDVGREDLVSILDQYLERMADPVAEFDGEVLKFMGDGMLATFPLMGQAEADTCRSAMMATQNIFTRIKNLNETRRAAGAPVMDLDIALHIGDVMYGNVGSADRLDFTVVGSAVNEVSRMESKCGELDTPIIISGDFVEKAVYCRSHFVPLGDHRLRGIKTPKALYSLKESSAYLDHLAV